LPTDERTCISEAVLSTRGLVCSILHWQGLCCDLPRPHLTCGRGPAWFRCCAGGSAAALLQRHRRQRHELPRHRRKCYKARVQALTPAESDDRGLCAAVGAGCIPCRSRGVWSVGNRPIYAERQQKQQQITIKGGTAVHGAIALSSARSPQHDLASSASKQHRRRCCRCQGGAQAEWCLPRQEAPSRRMLPCVQNA
jgi:hypothetical protein